MHSPLNGPVVCTNTERSEPSSSGEQTHGLATHAPRQTAARPGLPRHSLHSIPTAPHQWAGTGDPSGVPTHFPADDLTLPEGALPAPLLAFPKLLEVQSENLY